MIDVVVGGLYGDEGKGKIVGFLHQENKYDYVFRVNASTNASHCVNIEGIGEFVTKQLPSVFFDKSTKKVISPGALLNLRGLKNELLDRPDLDSICNNLFISNKISIVLDGYIKLNKKDKARKNIGSTNQGTGIAALSRVSKHSIFLYDVENAIKSCNIEKLKDKIKLSYDSIGFQYFGYEIENEIIELINDYESIFNLIGDFSIDYTSFILKLPKSSKILIEGCNGVLLDNIFGISPYVTSCSTTVSGLLSYANLSPHLLNKTYFILGAYSVCLNKRPFATEIFDVKMLNKISSISNEIDNAEGVKRRIGWFDVPSVKRSLCGHSGCDIILTKVDALFSLDKIKVCDYYIKDGEMIEYLPDNPIEMKNITPHYVEIDNSSIENYVNTISKLINYPIHIVGIGKNTNKIIKL